MAGKLKILKSVLIIFKRVLMYAASSNSKNIFLFSLIVLIITHRIRLCLKSNKIKNKHCCKSLSDRNSYTT